MTPREELEVGITRTLTQTHVVVGASALLALLCGPDAMAATSDAGVPQATASASVKKKIKKLNKKVALLQQQLDALSKQAGPQGAEGPQGPPGPSSGPAGGDLTGDYPNPSIAPGVLSGFLEGPDPIPAGDLSGTYASPEIKPGTVGTPESATVPAARVFHSASQGIPGSTLTTLDFDSEEFDTGNLHSTGGSPANQTLTAPVDGLYTVNAQLQWAINNDATIASAIILASNGHRAFQAVAPNPSTNTQNNISGLLRLNAGDTIQLRVVHDSASAATVFSTPSADIPTLSMVWVGPPA